MLVNIANKNETNEQTRMRNEYARCGWLYGRNKVRKKNLPYRLTKKPSILNRQAMNDAGEQKPKKDEHKYDVLERNRRAIE
jgi:hypothetical protein